MASLSTKPPLFLLLISFLQNPVFLTVLGILSLWLLCIALPSTSWAKVIVKERVKYYNIKGKTGEELMMSMIKRGPKASGLQHAIASMSPKVKFDPIKPVIKGRYCIVKDVNIKATYTYTYPRWRNQKKASPELKDAWNKLRKQLIRHERLHGSILTETLNRVRRKIMAQKGRVSKQCTDFGKNMQRELNRIFITYSKRQIAFDRREMRKYSRVSQVQRQLLKVK